MNVNLMTGRERADDSVRSPVYRCEKRAVDAALSNRLLSVSKIVAFALEVFR